ncbi:MAG TPA: hypothetical protein VK472_07615 [Allosphingosinicella sp.]|nr:hypothetical protein [Allosphingosinicella sp.]
MDRHDLALALAGIIGSCVALVHGLLVQRLMVRTIEKAFSAGGPVPRPIRRLVPPLLHFSTIVWLLGGLVLVVAALRFGPDARLATGLLVGATFLFGAVVNAWATRGRHPGWMLMALAVALIGYALAA